jgi:hypothetical protein
MSSISFPSLFQVKKSPISFISPLYVLRNFKFLYKSYVKSKLIGFTGSNVANSLNNVAFLRIFLKKKGEKIADNKIPL